jgi:hypothetical protein
MAFPDYQFRFMSPGLLRPFSAVRDLYMFGISTRRHRIVSALKELIGGGITEVLLAMRDIFLDSFIASGRVLEDIGRPVAARQLSGHTITVFLWEQLIDSDSYER